MTAVKTKLQILTHYAKLLEQRSQERPTWQCTGIAVFTAAGGTEVPERIVELAAEWTLGKRIPFTNVLNDAAKQVAIAFDEVQEEITATRNNAVSWCRQRYHGGHMTFCIVVGTPQREFLIEPLIHDVLEPTAEYVEQHQIEKEKLRGWVDLAAAKFLEACPEVLLEIEEMLSNVGKTKYWQYFADHYYKSHVHVDQKLDATSKVPGWQDGLAEKLVAVDTEGKPPCLWQACVETGLPGQEPRYTVYIVRSLKQLKPLLKDEAVKVLTWDREESLDEYKPVDVQKYYGGLALVSVAGTIDNVELFKNKSATFHACWAEQELDEEHWQYAAADAYWTLRAYLERPEFGKTGEGSSRVQQASTSV